MDRAEDLIVRHLEGLLDAREEQELAQILKDSAPVRALVASYLRLEGATIQIGESAGLHAASEKRDGAGSRVATRRSLPPPSRTPWVSWVLAALVLFGLIALIASLGRGEMASPSKEKQAAEARRKAQREAAARDASLQQAETARAGAEKNRRDAEERLQALRHDEGRLYEERKKADADRRKSADAAFAEAARKREEEEKLLARLREEEQRALDAKEAVVKSTPTPEAPDRPKTQSAVARMERVDGDVFVSGAAGRLAVKVGEDLLTDQVLETVGPGSRATFVYADNTRVELGVQSELRDLKIAGGKSLYLARGELRSTVSKQPLDRPMRILTPHGDATIIGTTVRMLVDSNEKGSSRLEVLEGKAQFKDPAGKVAIVDSGHYAVAAVGQEFAPRRLPIDNILLMPADAKLVGGDWRSLKDDKSFTGMALEGTAFLWDSDFKKMSESVRKPASFVLFTFQADADKDYQLWIHGSWRLKTTAAHHGSVAVVPSEGRFTNACPWFVTTGDNAFMFDWYSKQEGYWWVGGNEGDQTKSAVLRFPRTGEQTLRLHLSEPLRIDAIWLSATQKTRPPAGQRGVILPR